MAGAFREDVAAALREAGWAIDIAVVVDLDSGAQSPGSPVGTVAFELHDLGEMRERVDLPTDQPTPTQQGAPSTKEVSGQVQPHHSCKDATLFWRRHGIMTMVSSHSLRAGFIFRNSIIEITLSVSYFRLCSCAYWLAWCSPLSSSSTASFFGPEWKYPWGTRFWQPASLGLPHVFAQSFSSEN